MVHYNTNESTWFLYQTLWENIFTLLIIHSIRERSDIIKWMQSPLKLLYSYTKMWLYAYIDDIVWKKDEINTFLLI